MLNVTEKLKGISEALTSSSTRRVWSRLSKRARTLLNSSALAPAHPLSTTIHTMHYIHICIYIHIYMIIHPEPITITISTYAQQSRGDLYLHSLTLVGMCVYSPGGECECGSFLLFHTGLAVFIHFAPFTRFWYARLLTIRNQRL